MKFHVQRKLWCKSSASTFLSLSLYALTICLRDVKSAKIKGLAGRAGGWRDFRLSDPPSGGIDLVVRFHRTTYVISHGDH